MCAQEFRLAREGTSEDGLVANCKDCTSAAIHLRESTESEAAQVCTRLISQPLPVSSAQCCAGVELATR